MDVGAGRWRCGRHWQCRIEFQHHRSYTDAGAFAATALSIRRSDAFLTLAGNAAKPGGGPFADTSDVRIKNVLGDYTNGLTQIMNIKPIRFTYKGNDTI